MTSAELKGKFDPSIIDLGVVSAGAEVPFIVVNTSDYDIEGYTKSCGCVGTIKASAKNITGNIPATYKETSQVLYLVDGEYAQEVSQSGSKRYYIINTNRFIDGPKTVDGPYPAHLFSQSIGIKVKQDGVPDFVTTPDGEFIENPERLKVTLPIKMWVLKPTE